jgi:hypothetical protein
MINTKTVLFRVLPIIVSAAIGFALLEGLVRWKIGSPLEQRLPLVRVKADSEAGWRMLPALYLPTPSSVKQLRFS